jgi:signal peptidase I
VTRVLRWRSVASFAVQLAVLCLLLAAFFVRTPQVWGLSMEPQIHSGQYVLINTFAYRIGQPHRGDIVAFRHDANGRVFIKRVIGLAGDRIAIDRGTVSVNGAALLEPYVRNPDRRSFAQIVVPPQAVYVLGDNRANSEDSRVFGPVAENTMIGRAVAIIWPPHTLGGVLYR